MERRKRGDDLPDGDRGGSRPRSVRRGAMRTLVACAAALACLLSASAALAAAPQMRASLARRAASTLADRSRAKPSAHALARTLGLDARALTPSFAGPALGAGGGTIGGVVTSSTTKAPLGGIVACAFEPEESAELEEEPVFECAKTESDGEYSIAGLSPGSYVVEFRAPPGHGLNYQTQYYDGKSRERDATRVAVESGKITSAIDAALLPGGEITGRVTSAVTKGQLSEVLVCAIEAASEAGGCAFTGPSGEYTLEGLPSGSGYVVAFFPPEEEASDISYAIQFYDGAATQAGATHVGVVAGGAPTTNVDAALVEGVPQPRATPAIAGSVVAGQTLSVVHASWTNSPTSLVDTWGRCNAAGEKCFVAGIGPSYTLTATDVGHTMFVREVAHDAAGASEPAFSPLTPLVAPMPPVTPAPAPAVPVPAPTGNVLGVKVVSAAALRSLLERLLAPSGRNAKIGQLVKHRGYTVSFDALGAGKLTVSWYLVPKGARLAGAKPVLVAAGSVTTLAAGAAKLTIRLTGRGRGLLAHANRVKLIAKGSLAPSGQGALTATRPFSLSR